VRGKTETEERSGREEEEKRREEGKGRGKAKRESKRERHHVIKKIYDDIAKLLKVGSFAMVGSFSVVNRDPMVRGKRGMEGR